MASIASSLIGDKSAKSQASAQVTQAQADLKIAEINAEQADKDREFLEKQFEAQQAFQAEQLAFQKADSKRFWELEEEKVTAVSSSQVVNDPASRLQGGNMNLVSLVALTVGAYILVR